VRGGRNSPYGRQRPSVESFLKLCRFSDTIIALGVLLGLFVVDNLGRLPRGLDDFLGARLTVKNVLILILFAVCWHLSCRMAGMYDWHGVRSRRTEAFRACVATAGGTLAAAIFPLTSASGSFRMDLLLPFPILAANLILVARAALRWVTVSRVGESHKVLIVGTGPLAKDLYHRIGFEKDGDRDWHLVGFADSAPPGHEGAPNLVCSLDGLEQFLMTQEVHEVLIALPAKSCYSDIQRTIQLCERVGVPVKYPATRFVHARLEPRVVGSASGPLFSVPAWLDGPVLRVKRAIDLLGATVALLLLSPLLAAVALAVALTSPGPVLFSQIRYGRNRRRFRMYKFRTMVADAEALQPGLEEMNEARGPIFKIREDPRLTPIGAFLRHTSLDELPQLWNVLRGEMSLVGPRPMTPRDVHRFSQAWSMRRFSVVPGMSGLWQVSGRSDLTFDEWIQCDLAYIDHWSLTLDLWILARTIPAVLSQKGAE
jgi:exopolysaccharide biosynthesis polyprenyl glycosylphosphotransferase